MEKELEILLTIDENENITQRSMASKTGLSLGAVNLLIHKMIEMGFIKIERLNTHTVKYILTPKGMMEKAKKTYDYVKRTYENIMFMQREVQKIVESIPRDSTLCLYGKEDEVYHMLNMLFNKATIGKGVILKRAQTRSEICYKDIVVIWDKLDSNEDNLTGIQYINILDMIF